MQQTVVILVLVLAIGLFAWGRLRHDLVALVALFILVAAGVLDAEQAFLGFGHPAVITVAAVLVIGTAFERSGMIDRIGRWVAHTGGGRHRQVALLAVLVMVMSAFMNNVGALALMMPVALSMARQNGEPPSLYLMPLAFASLLGGMITLIGTPPNLIIAAYRAQETGTPFGLFAFAPVGASLAAVGTVLLVLGSRRLLPKRLAGKSGMDLFAIDDYITEVRLPAKSAAVGRSLKTLRELSRADIVILGLVRSGRHIQAPDPEEELQAGDVLILETEADDLKRFLQDTGSVLVGERGFRKNVKGARHISLREAAVMADAPLVGETAAGLRLRSRFGINLLAVARRRRKRHRRLDRWVFRAGDVLLLQGREHMLDEAIPSMGCLPLAPRGLHLGSARKAIVAAGIFAAALAAVVTGLLPVQAAFGMAAAAMVLANILPVKDLYTSIDWSVIVLLAAMLPVGTAFETSGAAAGLAHGLLGLSGRLPVWVLLSLLMLSTLLLSNIVNNAATAVIMAPIGIALARGLGVASDPFLMAVAVAASSAFLTPVGHQSNTLVMGPGGYAFSDYWRLGLPLSMIVLILGVPLILWVWPL